MSRPAGGVHARSFVGAHLGLREHVGAAPAAGDESDVADPRVEGGPDDTRLLATEARDDDGHGVSGGRGTGLGAVDREVEPRGEVRDGLGHRRRPRHDEHRGG